MFVEDHLKEAAMSRTGQRILWKEKHSDCIAAWCIEIDVVCLGDGGEQAVGNLQENPNAVACLAGGITASAVTQFFNDVQRVGHDFV